MSLYTGNSNGSTNGKAKPVGKIQPPSIYGVNFTASPLYANNEAHVAFINLAQSKLNAGEFVHSEEYSNNTVIIKAGTTEYKILFDVPKAATVRDTTNDVALG